MGNETGSSQQSVKSLFVPTAKQQEAQRLLREGQRHTLLIGGSRSGKTTLLVHEIALRALQSDQSRHAILRLHANAARASIALDTLPKVFRKWFPGRPLKRHRTEGYFSLENDSEIWIGGLDDQERVEKILGKEYATIFLNECSQIPYSSVLIALTRLAQVARDLPQSAFYDLNPTGKGHWTNVLFGELRDPVSRQPLENPDDYARLLLNPGDNAANLSPAYLKSLEALPERQRKRFFEGIYIDELAGALFSYETIARARVAELGETRRVRVVVAVDPSGAAGRDDETADEIGIVVAAKGDDGHAYVLADRSLRDAPAAWGRAVAQAYHEFKADRIIAEENFGGEMVRYVLRTADPNARVLGISASRGKVLRAEPVSALYEQGLVHHVGRFAVLEDQLCAFTTAGYRGEGSPDHADALVFAITDLLLNEPAAIIEFYRVRVEERRTTPAEAGARMDETLIRLRAPEGISGAHGLSSAFYLVGNDRVIAVKPQDAAGLIAAGFTRVPEQQT
jgi:phage terminase large subunit-like protein